MKPVYLSGIGVAILIFGALLCPWEASAQGKGEGGIVVGETASVYRGSTGEEVEATLKRGDAVAGIMTAGIFGDTFEFEEEDGRVHVMYFRPPKTEGVPLTAWMNPGDLTRFLYDCGCDREKKPNCRPYMSEFLKAKWNACFREARDAKLADLRTEGAKGAGTPAGASAQGPVVPAGSHAPASEKPLTNDDVVALVGLDLGDDLVISKIQQAPVEALDVSTEALIKLKQTGVSKAVLDAMLKRASLRRKEVDGDPS